MIGNIVSFIVGAIFGIFFYRNNESKVSKVADKVDEVYDEATKEKK